MFTVYLFVIVDVSGKRQMKLPYPQEEENVKGMVSCQQPNKFNALVITIVAIWVANHPHSQLRS